MEQKKLINLRFYHIMSNICYDNSIKPININCLSEQGNQYLQSNDEKKTQSFEIIKTNLAASELVLKEKTWIEEQ